MKRYRLFLWILWIDFAIFSLWVCSQVGYWGIWQAGCSSLGALQITADLVLCASLGCCWLVSDARRRGLSPWPWVVATLIAGSLGLLAYLLYIGAQDSSSQSSPNR